MTDTEKKTRTPKPIAVESRVGVGNVHSWAEENRCSTISEAEKWIKAMGKEDTTYRIITIERELTLKVTQKRMASFA